MSGGEEKPAAASGGGGGGGGSKIVLILGAMNLLVTAGMVGVLFMSFQRDKQATEVADVASADGHGGGDGEHGAPAADAHGGGGGHGAPAADAHGGGGGHGGGKKAPGRFGKMVQLDQFTVNLSVPGSPGPKFVRVNIAIEVPGDDVETELSSKMPQVRNTIIDLFNSKRPVDLAQADGRDFLKEEIRNALNGFLVTGKVKGVFFTNFAIGS